MRKFLLAVPFLCLLFDAQPSLGQGPAEPAAIVPYRQLPISPAPNAASLGKFGAIPVNQYAGTPKVEVPLYEIQQGDVRVPLTLAYHSALKVAETPSWVGLGWALAAGGVITQTIRGRADQGPGGYWSQKAVVDSLNPRLLDVGHHPYSDQVFKGLLDTQPDSYYYNLPGMSGQLVFSDPTHAFPVTERGLDIRFTHDRFYVTDRNGTLYILGSSGADRDYTEVETDDADGTARGGTSAYYLSLIVSANRQDTVYFRYDAEDFSQEMRGTETDFIPPTASVPLLPKSLTTSIQRGVQHRIREIRWKNGSVLFTATSARPDLPGARALDRIDVRDTQGRVLKSYGFSYGYFYSTTKPPTTPEEQRLKLVEVKEMGGTVAVPGHKFRYYEHQPLPPRNSCQQDHWGFANRNSKPTLLPATYLTSDGVATYKDGGSREPDFKSALAGVLKEIIYPTGGSTRLVYEPHMVHWIGNKPATKLVRTVKSVGLTTRDFPDGDEIGDTLSFTLTKATSAELMCTLAARQTDRKAFAQITASFSKNSLVQNSWTATSGGSTSTAGTSSPILMTLSPGTYTLIISGWAEHNASSWACGGTISLTLVEPVPADVIVGGVRIKRLVDQGSGGADSLVQHYTYGTQEDGTAVSSGVLVSSPIYTSTYQHHYIDRASNTTTSARYISLSSAPTAGLGLTQGSHVGYQRVTVSSKNGTLDNGSQVLYFTSAREAPDQAATNPYHPPISRDYKRGWLVRQTYHSPQGGLLKQVRNTYRVDLRGSQQLRGLMLHKIRSDEALRSKLTTYRYDYFRDESWWVYLAATTTTTYAPGDTTQRQVEQQTFVYGNPAHGQVTQTRRRTSTGQTRVHYLRYPPDYPAQGTDAPCLGVRQLQTAHAWAAVIEESEWLKQPQTNDSVLLRSVLHTYRPRIASPLSVEDKLYTLLPGTVTTYLRPTTTAAGWQMDPRYQEQERYPKYDRYDNPEHILRGKSTIRGQNTNYTYLWGHRGERLLAQVQGATPAQTCFTSFEVGSTGRWQYDSLSPYHGPTHFTGLRGYGLDGTPRAAISRDGLAAGEYELWVWGHGPGVPLVSGPSQQHYQADAVGGTSGWRQHRFRLTVPANGTVRINSAPGPLLWIDELRLHPVGAQLTSYTYDPLLGRTSQTDPTGRTIFYEYDGLGRLLRGRDDQGRVLADQEYYYARP